MWRVSRNRQEKFMFLTPCRGAKSRKNAANQIQTNLRGMSMKETEKKDIYLEYRKTVQAAEDMIKENHALAVALLWRELDTAMNHADYRFDGMTDYMKKKGLI
jgi:hypothetical protein